VLCAVLRERDQALIQSEQSAAGLLRLVQTTIHMVHYLTRVPALVTPFVSDEFVQRVASTLDFYLVKLNGPSVSELKVDHPEKYGFHPRVMLPELVGIFLNLSVSDKFLSAVASDER
jgi:ubiquitin conjugation factor E4 B